MSYIQFDPEQPDYLQSFIKELNVSQECFPIYTGTWNTRDFWKVDLGYCLDRYSSVDCEGRAYEF